MHHMLIILTLTLILGHTDLNHEYNTCSNYLRNYSSTAHQVCCELYIYCPTEGLSNLCQYDYLDLLSWSQLRLKLVNILTCSLAVIYPTVVKLYGIQTWHDDIFICMAYIPMLRWITLTLTLLQGHSGLAE